MDDNGAQESGMDFYAQFDIGWLLSSVKKGKPKIIISTLAIFPCTSFGFSMNSLTII